MKLLLRAIAGSRLYNTHHSDSDFDYYEVWSQSPNRKRKARQTIKDGIDTIQVGLSDWMRLCETSHQALDCMMADPSKCEIDHIYALRASYRIHIGSAVPAFQRVIKSFEDGNLKQRRHAMRLQWCIDEMLLTGRYHPTLNDQQLQQLKVHYA